MVVIVTDPILVASRRPGGLDASDEAPLGQQTERVVDRLARDGTDLGPGDIGDVVRRAVWSTGDRPQDGETLRRDLDPVSAKQVRWRDGWLPGHGRKIRSFLDSVKNWIKAISIPSMAAAPSEGQAVSA